MTRLDTDLSARSAEALSVASRVVCYTMGRDNLAGLSTWCVRVLRDEDEDLPRALPITRGRPRARPLRRLT